MKCLVKQCKKEEEKKINFIYIFAMMNQRARGSGREIKELCRYVG